MCANACCRDVARREYCVDLVALIGLAISLKHASRTKRTVFPTHAGPGRPVRARRLIDRRCRINEKTRHPGHFPGPTGWVLVKRYSGPVSTLPPGGATVSANSSNPRQRGRGVARRRATSRRDRLSPTRFASGDAVTSLEPGEFRRRRGTRKQRGSACSSGEHRGRQDAVGGRFAGVVSCAGRIGQGTPVLHVHGQYLPS